MTTTVIGSEATAAPDWGSVREDVSCPLCEYNLRGLVQPRCPECGYQFRWDEVLNPGVRKHPYLFEHHPRRNVWSFPRTKLGTAAPWRFWRTLKPAMPVKPRRLLLYWLLAATPVCVVVISGFVGFMRTKADELAWKRQLLAMQLRDDNKSRLSKALLATYGSAQAAIDATCPRPPSMRFLAVAWSDYFRLRWVATSSIALPAILAFLAWPWVTLGALLIFQVSMRRAKVRAVHVLRCAIYSCDSALLAGLAVGALVPQPMLWSRWDFEYVLGLPVERASYDFLIVGGVIGGLTLYKLGFAYRHYLRFPRPWTVAIASQVLAVMAVVTAAQVWQDHFAG